MLEIEGESARETGVNIKALSKVLSCYNTSGQHQCTLALIL